MRTLMLAVGVLAVLLGLHWIGQGTGYFPYPMIGPSAMMIHNPHWTYIGLATAVIGLGLVWYSRR